MNKSTFALLTIAFVALSSFASAEPSSKKKAPAKAAQKTEAPAEPVVIETSSSFHFPTLGEILLAGLEDSNKKPKAQSADSKPEETKTDVSVSNKSGAPKMELVTVDSGKSKKIGYGTTATSTSRTNKPRRLAIR